MHVRVLLDELVPHVTVKPKKFATVVSTVADETPSITVVISAVSLMNGAVPARIPAVLTCNGPDTLPEEPVDSTTIVHSAVHNRLVTPD